MTTIIDDPRLEDQLREHRKVTGADRYDEVWEGVYMMGPLANDEHQMIVTRLAYVLEDVVGRPGLGQVRAGVNLSDRADDWEQDYRCPAVALFLNDGGAENLGTHWMGAADFLVEIVSPRDKTREKLPFYQRIGVRELLIVDRRPWRLELWRRESGVLVQVASCEPGSDGALHSRVVPLTFRLLSAEPRPQIEVAHCESEQRWLL